MALSRRLILLSLSPLSWPGIAVRRTASLRSPMSRPSTSFPSKAWMRGTSPRMTMEHPLVGPHARRRLVEKLVQPLDRFRAAGVFGHHAFEIQAVVVTHVLDARQAVGD